MCNEADKDVKSRTADEIKIGCTIIQGNNDIYPAKKET